MGAVLHMGSYIIIAEKVEVRVIMGVTTGKNTRMDFPLGRKSISELAGC